ncbi:hypothetical protein BH10PSE2_BH10PSE2_23010 [soil metagenome]
MAEKSTLTDSQRRPPIAVSRQAERGLRLRETHGRGGTEVGVRRAHQLANREPVSERDVKDIYSYFARHTVDKAGTGWADRAKPSAGYIAWLLWGGDAGEAWIGRLHARLTAEAS